MNRLNHRFLIHVAICLAVLAWIAAATVAARGSGQASGGSPHASGLSSQAGAGSSQAVTPPPAPSADFVGDDTCVACHEGQGKALSRTLHGKAKNERTPTARTNQACETCHGPGREHAETGDKAKIRRFTAISAREAVEVCATCHNKGIHATWRGSMHDARNLSCVTCHSVHSPKSEVAQLKTATITETCVTCHKTEVSKLQRVGHMPVREGKMECTSCHNPHGSTNVRMLKIGNSVNELCVSCHTEKRGPFLWDHAPIREGCNTCHDPHGSNNDRMLIAKLPMMCQRCHIGTRHPSTIYDGTQLAARSNRLIGRGCVNCHAQIHGSNSPAGNTFLR